MSKARARRQVTVITEAAESPHAQLRRRQIQYSVLMGLRVVCLILAAVLVSVHAPFVLFWILLLTVGMVVFLWMAVIIANDRPPKKASRFTTRLHRGNADQHSLPSAATASDDADGEPESPSEPPRSVPPAVRGGTTPTPRTEPVIDH